MAIAEDLDLLAAQMAVTVAPALVTAVYHNDARLVEQLLSGLDRQRLYTLAVILATFGDDPAEPGPPPQTPAEARREDYAFLRSSGVPLEEAARRVGVQATTARDKYEPRLKEENT